MSCNFADLIYPNSVLVDTWSFSICKMCRLRVGSFTSCFPVWMCSFLFLASFPWQEWWSRCACLAPAHSEKAFSPIKYDVSVGVTQVPLFRLSKCPSVLNLRVFFLSWKDICLSSAFCVCWDDHVVFVLYSTIMVYCVDDGFLCVEPTLHFWDRSHLIML